ncbi:hypothetical protein G647_09736 [Cladophialophora carrionii CBS 160.54]|uniref:Monopolin complex subunit Csm1/Pcs1 C-terminal domain-containing protein n=1 Tax=Cladophialophora carrionii CBS 160.54 TaxID=1279043 RepID=V9DL18_9EURO|nr:uncharacterized protein G647_09736 [Cladophialophora carrionii CBS 160.54]ETI27545.1 hypothetical protein G647_09736 [Cladophialophora carrionii CBS 160.54]
MKGIADLLDSDMEDSAPFVDENSILSSASDATNATSTKATQAKRGKKRQRVTMPPKSKSKPQRSAPSETKKAPPKQTAGVKRKASEDQIDPESHENLDGTLENAGAQTEALAPKTKKRHRPAGKAKSNIKALETQEQEDDLVDVDEAPVQIRSKHAATKTSKQASKVANKAVMSAESRAHQRLRTVVSEPQLEEEETSALVDTASPPKPRPVIRNPSRTREDAHFRRRAGSASDAERGDPNLRRKLGDITRKYENVDLKYRNLKEVGVNEASANMERLRKQCDATMQASNDLIASLKKELATQAPLAHETRRLKQQMQSQEEEMGKMRETTADLTTSLAAAQNEIKALQAKLAAARASSVDHPKTPGSAMKSSAHRSVVASNADAAKTVEIAQMKLDLYSDLTGLVVLNLKKTEEGHSYECIQTGQNGTLHFRLFVDQEIAKTMTFEDTEYLYTPLLDPDRDHEMIKLMPGYLTEEITFARLNASKFYGRVVDTLTKKRAED